MRILDKPKVYLIARPQIVEDGLQEFLDDQGLHWPTPTEGVEDAARLIEIAGRCCYMSFGAKAGSKTNKRYIQNLLGRNSDGTFKPGPAHGCYDVDTEVLTENGWKFWPDVTEDDKLATLNNEHKVEYHKPIRLISYKHEGKMYHVKSLNVDLLVTPDHKMFTCLTATKQGRFRELGSYSLMKAEGIGFKAHAYYKGSNGLNCVLDINDNPAIMALLGFAIGDDVSYKDIDCVRFNTRSERKISWLKKTARLANRILTQQKNGTWSLRLEDDEISLFRKIYTDDDEKKMPEVVLHCSYLDSLYEGLMQSSGFVEENGSSRYYTTSETLAGQFQQLCLHIGIAADVHQVDEYVKSLSHKDDKCLYRVCMVRDNLKPKVNEPSLDLNRSNWVDDFSGDVFCAEVPNNTLYIRRNGKTVWSGNSVCEHPCWSFLVVGSGRGFSHEQVRHRVGWAYSQLSTRYCDFEREEQEGTWDPGFCIPPLAQLSGESRASVESALKKSQELYCEILASIENDLKNNPNFREKLDKLEPREAKRMLRKAARGAARDVLPIATEAIMTMSANARSIWNVIVLRANEHAEAVIRDIYVQIAKIMEKELPALFNGMEYIKCWDGTEAVVMPRDKL